MLPRLAFDLRSLFDAVESSPLPGINMSMLPLALTVFFLPNPPCELPSPAPKLGFVLPVRGVNCGVPGGVERVVEVEVFLIPSLIHEGTVLPLWVLDSEGLRLTLCSEAVGERTRLSDFLRRRLAFLLPDRERDGAWSASGAFLLPSK